MAIYTKSAPIEIFKTLGSTNEEARSRISSTGETSPVWILARHQTNGYGRRGRAWSQATGDLAASLLLDPDCDRAALGQYSFIAALAVASGIDALAPSSAPQFKWPNDILIDNKKLAGILLEFIPSAGHNALIIGIGVNLVNAPDDTEFPATRLEAYLREPVMAETLLEGIDRTFWSLVASWKRQGFGSIRREWISRAANLGHEITVRLPGETFQGIFEDIDDNGALILNSAGGRRLVHAGDVFFAS